MEEIFSDAEKEKIRRFADRITPKNWNIWIYPKDCKYIPRILSIRLWFHNDDTIDARMGSVHGSIQVYPISIFKEVNPEAAKALKKYGDGSSTQVTIEIYPVSVFVGLEDTIIHELAHVAVGRYETWQQKPLKHKSPFVFKEPEDGMHGTLFQRFYRIMLHRAEKVFGKERVKEQWRNLEFYEKELYKD